MHSLDGTDWLPMLVIAAASVVAAVGVGTWRYERLSSPGKIMFTPVVLRQFGIGIAAIAAAFVVARLFDSTDETDIIPFITEQGLRAILFMIFIAVAARFLAVAVYHARETSAATKSLALGAVAVLTFVVALFIQGEATGAKFRTELFGMLSILAMIMLFWSVASAMFAVRDSENPRADRLGRRLAMIGGLLMLAGVLVRLLFTIQAEIDEGNTTVLAKFSIRIVWFVGFAVVMSYILRKTPFGGWVYAVGGNKEAARQIGVPAARTKTQLFMLVAGAAWLVGILLAFRLNSIQAGTGNGLEFEYIIAAVVGGTLLTGGYGSVLGAAIGALIMAMSAQGISFAGWNTDWRNVFLGSILLVAVVANGYVRRIAEAAR
jgi:ribose/xylose/arabinose/galactoside ABC-type transport system permease subunit